MLIKKGFDVLDAIPNAPAQPHITRRLPFPAAVLERGRAPTEDFSSLFFGKKIFHKKQLHRFVSNYKFLCCSFFYDGVVPLRIASNRVCKCFVLVCILTFLLCILLPRQFFCLSSAQISTILSFICYSINYFIRI